MTPASLDPSSYLFTSLVGQIDEGDARLRGGQEECDHLQDLGIALRSVIESGGIDEGHHSPVESELFGDLDLGRARLQPYSDG